MGILSNGVPQCAPSERSSSELSSDEDYGIVGSNRRVRALPKSNGKSSVVNIGDDEKQPASNFGHLPEHERTILQRQLDVPTSKVSMRTLFRYATKIDVVLMLVAGICAIAAGAVMPLMTVIFGNLSNTFKGYFLGTVSQAQFQDQLGKYTLYFIYLGAAEFVTIYVATAGFLYTGEHIARKIREQYLAAILRQNIGYFDKLGAGEITTRITADTNLIQDGISEKIALTLTALSVFATAFVIGFIKYWKLTLILSSVLFGLMAVFGGGLSFLIRWNKRSLESYASGGTIAEEVLSSIRNATAFGTQDRLARQYDKHLAEAERWGFRQKALLGLAFGLMMMILYLGYGLAFWQGSRYLVAHEGGVSLSTILTILLSIMIGSFALGNVSPYLQAFTTSVAAAEKIYSTIDRVSPLDPSSNDGLKLEPIVGTVELKNVKHIYPSRPEVVVMEDVSLHIPASKTTALVGASGSGKSTIVGLCLRFYDPVGGQVFVDGHDVRNLNLQHLRQQISLVSQEPTLFGGTIEENIAFGLVGSRFEHSAKLDRKELIVAAAKMANAHDFIMSLPKRYKTKVGERGFLLSGGQKQRIAIARAVVSDPKILLLDEATSALDTKSEGVVQAALERAAQGRTTIVIAHRLSTIRTADNIVVMSQGRIVEQGTHDELLLKKAAYYKLVEAQRITGLKRVEECEYDDVVLAEKQDDLKEIPTLRWSYMSFSRRLSRTVSSVSGRIRRRYVPNDNEPVTALPRFDQPYIQRDEAMDKVAPPKAPSLWQLIKLIASFNREELWKMLFGLLMSAFCGAAEPVQAVFFAKEIVALSLPPQQYGLLRSQVNYWSLMFLMLACVQLISYTCQGVAFAYCSEKLIRRVRDQSFRTMLRQDIGWFDREENSAGALTTFLSTETTHVAGLSGSTLGTLLSVLTTLIGAFALSIALGWNLALVCIATVPVLLACGFLRFYLLGRLRETAQRAYEHSASYACENTSAIRTVASLTLEQHVWNTYHEQLVEQGARSLRSILKSSTLYAASQAFVLLCTALGFWYGGLLISRGQINEQNFFICFTAVIFGAQSAGTIFSFAPDMSKAKHAAAAFKKLFDRVPSIDSWSPAGEAVPTLEGALEFRDVHFRYPTRPEQPVLRGLNLRVEPGAYVALVGASGSGKSTTIALLQRFYDAAGGQVLVDGRDVTTLNLAAYRSHIALVSQEPTLYAGTIRDNILLGAPDGAVIPASRVTQVCADANITDFVASLPDGLDTVVGNKGVMLSGGQKQRIAIARALLRDPKVLLLDEATSALDSESERVVQAALDRAAKGRTTVAVAHRLATIQRADCICVVDAGVVVESGTHAELLAKRGRYFELVQLQSLDKSG